jgi:hypothetical protein
MATKKQIAAIVKAAKASHDAAKAAGIPNPAPYGLIKVRFLRETKTARFKLAKGECWSPPYTSFTDDEVEIGYSPIPLHRFEIIGLDREFTEEDREDFEEYKRISACPCAQSVHCLCAGHARGNAADAPCDTSES